MSEVEEIKNLKQLHDLLLAANFNVIINGKHYVVKLNEKEMKTLSSSSPFSGLKIQFDINKILDGNLKSMFKPVVNLAGA